MHACMHALTLTGSGTLFLAVLVPLSLLKDDLPLPTSTSTLSKRFSVLFNLCATTDSRSFVFWICFRTASVDLSMAYIDFGRESPASFLQSGGVFSVSKSVDTVGKGGWIDLRADCSSEEAERFLFCGIPLLLSLDFDSTKYGDFCLKETGVLLLTAGGRDSSSGLKSSQWSSLESGRYILPLNRPLPNGICST